MKAIMATLALMALTGAAEAQGRPSTTGMTCGQAARLVATRGAVVLATGRDTYDRYVRSPGFCDSGYYARPAFVPARDNPQCNIGYYCSSMPPFWER